MVNLKIYQICYNLITYFVTLTSPKKSQLNLIFNTGGSNFLKKLHNYCILQTLALEASDGKLEGDGHIHDGRYSAK